MVPLAEKHGLNPKTYLLQRFFLDLVLTYYKSNKQKIAKAGGTRKFSFDAYTYVDDFGRFEKCCVEQTWSEIHSPALFILDKTGRKAQKII